MLRFIHFAIYAIFGFVLAAMGIGFWQGLVILLIAVAGSVVAFADGLESGKLS